MFFVLFCSYVFASCTPHEIKYSGNGSTDPTDYKYVAEVFVYPHPYYSLVSSNNLSATDSFTIMCGNLDTLKGFLANQFIDYGTYIDSNLMFKYTIYVEGLEHNNNNYYKTDYLSDPHLRHFSLNIQSHPLNIFYIFYLYGQYLGVAVKLYY